MTGLPVGGQLERPSTLSKPRADMTATSIGIAAAHRMVSGRDCHVHSVFPRAINLATEEGLICMVRADVGRGPLNVVLDMDRATGLDALGVAGGMRARMEGNALVIGKGLLAVRLGAATPYPSPRHPRPIISNIVRANLLLLRDEILLAGRREGLGGLILQFRDEGIAHPRTQMTQVQARALPPLVKLLRAITTQCLSEIPDAARGLIGLGPGLTPSGDDLLVGLMIALLFTSRTLADEEFARATNRMISSEARGRTTMMSLDFILQATEGLGNEHLIDLVESVLSGTPSLVRTTARRELETGATSGTDAAFGVFLGVSLGLTGEVRPS